MSDCINRITNYLLSGGLFNPELMEHEKVKELLIDCRDDLKELEQRIETQGKNLHHYTTLQLELEQKLEIVVEALEFYARDDANWIAREALEKIKG